MKKVQKGYIKRVFTKNCFFEKKHFGQKSHKIHAKKTVFLEKVFFSDFYFFGKKKYFFEIFWGGGIFFLTKKSTKIDLEPRLSIK